MTPKLQCNRAKAAWTKDRSQSNTIHQIATAYTPSFWTGTQVECRNGDHP